MSILTSGKNNGMYGKKHSEKSKQLMSLYAQYIRDNNVYRTEEFKEHMSSVTAKEKNGMFNKKDENAVNGKIILMYDENYILEREFASKKMALQFLKLKGHLGLDNAIKTHTLYKGHYWEVKEK